MLNPFVVYSCDVHCLSISISFNCEIIQSNSLSFLEWFPTNLQSVHAVMQYNIAVTKTIKGQFDQASTILKQVWQQRSKVCRVPAHIVMLFIYIELQLGKKHFVDNISVIFHIYALL